MSVVLPLPVGLFSPVFGVGGLLGKLYGMYLHVYLECQVCAINYDICVVKVHWLCQLDIMLVISSCGYLSWLAQLLSLQVLPGTGVASYSTRACKCDQHACY